MRDGCVEREGGGSLDRMSTDLAASAPPGRLDLRGEAWRSGVCAVGVEAFMNNAG